MERAQALADQRRAHGELGLPQRPGAAGVGAGRRRQAGQCLSLIHIFKPALARGELRTIAATTWSEYKKYFEKDAALARRFQVVKVEEPSETLAASMLRGMAPLMERHFGVRILDEAIVAAARLSHRYISGRQLPDKAVGVLDTACLLYTSKNVRLLSEHEPRDALLTIPVARVRRTASAGDVYKRQMPR